MSTFSATFTIHLDSKAVRHEIANIPFSATWKTLSTRPSPPTLSWSRRAPRSDRVGGHPEISDPENGAMPAIKEIEPFWPREVT